MACIIKSVTLAEGETFVLPPGAELIGATDPGAITSVNDCAPTDNLQTLACYTCIIGVGAEDGNASQLWEAEPTGGSGGGSLRLTDIANRTSLGLADTFYAFTSTFDWLDYSGFRANGGVGAPALDALEAEVMTLIGDLGVISCNVTQAINSTNYQNLYVTIVTFPSVAENLSMRVRTSATISGEIVGFFKFFPTTGTYVQEHPTPPQCSLTTGAQ